MVFKKKLPTKVAPVPETEHTKRARAEAQTPGPSDSDISFVLGDHPATVLPFFGLRTLWRRLRGKRRPKDEPHNRDG